MIMLSLTAVLLVGMISFGTMKTSDMPALDQKHLYEFTMKTLEGEDRSLKQYEGKVLMIVNVASKCGYTPQYEGLQDLYERYKDRGFMILGFPANNFLWQEPGTDEEIRQFCSIEYGVTFDMYSKISVKGSDQHPLYAFITSQEGIKGPVKWNFQKYLVDRKGNVVSKFMSGTEPLDEEVTSRIEELLSDR